MREILFRGKTEAGEWLTGFLIGRYDPSKKENIIKNAFIDNGTCFYSPEKVIPETVGEFTGLTDKNGKRIFEGDILEFSDRFVVVFWHTHLGCWDSNFLKFTNRENGRDDMSPLNWGYKSKVIGNIHDNPELLEVR